MNLHREIISKIPGTESKDKSVLLSTDKQTPPSKINKQVTYILPDSDPELGDTSGTEHDVITDTERDVNRLMYERSVMNSAALFNSIEELQGYLLDHLGVLPYKAAMDKITAAQQHRTPFQQLCEELGQDVLAYFPLFVQLLQLKWVAHM